MILFEIFRLNSFCESKTAFKVLIRINNLLKKMNIRRILFGYVFFVVVIIIIAVIAVIIFEYSFSFLIFRFSFLHHACECITHAPRSINGLSAAASMRAAAVFYCYIFFFSFYPSVFVFFSCLPHSSACLLYKLFFGKLFSARTK